LVADLGTEIVHYCVGVKETDERIEIVLDLVAILVS